MERYEFHLLGRAHFEFYNDDTDSIARFLSQASAYTDRPSPVIDSYKLSIERITEMTEGHIAFHKKHGGGNYSVLEIKKSSVRIRSRVEVIIMKSFGLRTFVDISTRSARKGKTCIKHRKGRVPMELELL